MPPKKPQNHVIQGSEPPGRNIVRAAYDEPSRVNEQKRRIDELRNRQQEYFKKLLKESAANEKCECKT